MHFFLQIITLSIICLYFCRKFVSGPVLRVFTRTFHIQTFPILVWFICFASSVPRPLGADQQHSGITVTAKDKSGLVPRKENDSSPNKS